MKNDFEYNKILDFENRIKQENENISELEKEMREKYINNYNENNNNNNNNNNENDENEFQINNKIAEEFGSKINTLRNENLFLKQNLEEKNKIIESFQNVSVEAQEKMKELINQNQKLCNEMYEIKNKLLKYKIERKENNKKKQNDWIQQIESLKTEINTLNDNFKEQLNEKEILINDLKETCKNLQNQIEINKKVNNLENICKENNPINQIEEKFAFYKSYNKPLSIIELDKNK